METRSLETAPGMVFDVSVEGDDDAPLVPMLHGFGVSRFFWNAQVHAVAEAGYFAVAPNQRGYAAGARPDPADHASYRVDRLIGDALDIVAAVGHGDRRFHLVGHDWGASLAWQIADQHPERLASLTILSRPHPLAFAGRWNCRMASSGDGHGTIDIPRSRCRPEHPGGQCELAADAPDQERCAAGRDRGAPVRHRQPIRRWKRRWHGIGRAVCVISRWDRRGCQRCLSGAIRTTRLAGRQPRGQASSSPRHTSSRLCRVLATMRPTKCRNRSTHCSWRILPAIRFDHRWLDRPWPAISERPGNGQFRAARSVVVAPTVVVTVPIPVMIPMVVPVGIGVLHLFAVAAAVMPLGLHDGDGDRTRRGHPIQAGWRPAFSTGDAFVAW